MALITSDCDKTRSPEPNGPNYLGSCARSAGISGHENACKATAITADATGTIEGAIESLTTEDSAAGLAGARADAGYTAARMFTFEGAARAPAARVAAPRRRVARAARAARRR